LLDHLPYEAPERDRVKLPKRSVGAIGLTGEVRQVPERW